MGDPSVGQMSEKEKSHAGMLYNPFTPDLTEERKVCKDLTWEFNHIAPRKTAEKKALLKQLFGKERGN